MEQSRVARSSSLFLVVERRQKNVNHSSIILGLCPLRTFGLLIPMKGSLTSIDSTDGASYHETQGNGRSVEFICSR
jgi:hypothetical protein